MKQNINKWKKLPIREVGDEAPDPSSGYLLDSDGSVREEKTWPGGLEVGVCPLGDGTCTWWDNTIEVRTRVGFRPSARGRIVAA
jgi:hypothetical protein